jgi:lysophospholipase L1-like esterase
MKTILCYGDSNTWGYNPATQERYGHDQRWTRQLQALLGGGYWVIEEGQNGRTTVHDDPVEGNKNGLTYLMPCLESHKPLDMVVLMLGTNDLKLRMSKTSQDIAKSVGRLVKLIQSSESGPGNTVPEVLVIAPPPLGKLTDFADSFSGGSDKSRSLGSWYRVIAEERGCAFLDAGTVIRSSDVDGIHFDADQLPLLAAAVREFIVVALS